MTPMVYPIITFWPKGSFGVFHIGIPILIGMIIWFTISTYTRFNILNKNIFRLLPFQCRTLFRFRV
jgi:hypothetical protein